jgi:acyl carrier protein
MEEKVKYIMASVFETSTDEINDLTVQGSLANWDSVRHLSLVVSLEEEFEVRFSDDQIADMQSYRLIIYTLRELGVQ